MRSTAALKAACLAAGVATAWSPLVVQPAKAGSVVDLTNINFGASGFQRFEDVFVGFSFNNSPTEFFHGPYDLTGLGEFSFPASEHAPDEFDQFVLVGLTGGDTDNPLQHVVVSFASPHYSEFDSIFDMGTYGSETTVAAQLNAGDTTFLQKIFDNSPTDVLQSLTGVGVREGSASMVVFSEGQFGGSFDVSVGPAPVPLPPGVMMGGAMLAMLASGKYVRDRLASRQPA